MTRYLGITRYLALLALLAASTARAAPVAHLPDGPVTGVVVRGMNAFLGLRYAAPPIGHLRWQPPQSVAQTTTTATRYGAHCPQAASAYGAASTTEDCLFLNVFTPRDGQRAPSPHRTALVLPVMVWIHGGAFTVGESDDYDPSPLIATGRVIVVTVNYRLGYLGFLATAGLDAEGHPRGNYGLQDQQAALGWVRHNIAGFGGDPDRVTIFGESAGGLSILSNLASPTAHGLFGGAIVQSGAYALTLPTVAQAEAAGAKVAKAIGCAASDTACLRSASVAKLVAQGDAAGDSITPLVDGVTLKLSIGAALRSGQFNRVPVVNGSTSDEFRQFLPAKAGLTAAQYPTMLADTQGRALGAAIAAEYPASSYKMPVLTLGAAMTDKYFACTARLVDRWVSRYAPVFGYEFADRQAPQDFLPPAAFPFGAYHASEIQFLFDLPKRLPAVPSLTTAQRHLSAAMANYWTGFALARVPASDGIPAWAAYANGADRLETLQPAGAVHEDDFATVHHCAFWKPVIDPT